MYLASYPFPVRKGEVLHHMFTKNAVKRLLWERKRAAKVNQIMHILITKPIDIHPMGIVKTPRARTEIEKQRRLPIGEKVANSGFL